MLILTHELGHYITARIFDVHILEFSIGMGPKLISKKSKKTGIIYSLRLLPIGGFVQMVGENGDETMTEEERQRYASETSENTEPEFYDAELLDDPRALSGKPIWQRMIIIAAGGLTNIIIGILLTFALVMSMPVLGSTVIGEFDEGASSSAVEKLQEGDVVVKVGHTRVSTHMMLAYEIMHSGYEPIDITVIRGADIKYSDDGKVISYSGGEREVIKDVEFPKEQIEGCNVVYGVMDFRVYASERTAGLTFRSALEYSRMMIKTVWDSIFDLIRGRYGVEAISGPVGVSREVGSAAKSGGSSLLYLVVLLSINLGVVNLLPIPALDGGQMVFYLIELIRGKPISAEIRGRINAVALMLLFGFAILIMIKDVIQLML